MALTGVGNSRQRSRWGGMLEQALSHAVAQRLLQTPERHNVSKLDSEPHQRLRYHWVYPGYDSLRTK